MSAKEGRAEENQVKVGQQTLFINEEEWKWEVDNEELIKHRGEKYIQITKREMFMESKTKTIDALNAKEISRQVAENRVERGEKGDEIENVERKGGLGGEDSPIPSKST